MSWNEPMKTSLIVLSAIAGLAAPAAPHTNWIGSIELAPTGSVEFVGSAMAWPADAWALEWWLETAPGTGQPTIDAGEMEFTCALGSCEATVFGILGGQIHLDFGAVYPYSVYAMRVEAWHDGFGIHARALLSGSVVDSGDIPDHAFAPAVDMTVSSLGLRDHAFFLPMRLWSIVGFTDAESESLHRMWLFQGPALTDPGLVGLWRQEVGGVVVDEAGTADGILSVGASSFDPLCWNSVDLIIFSDGFEDGGTSRWVAIGLGAICAADCE